MSFRSSKFLTSSPLKIFPFKYASYFGAVLGSQQRIEQRALRIPIYYPTPTPATCPTVPTINILHQEGVHLLQRVNQGIKSQANSRDGSLLVMYICMQFKCALFSC